MDLLQQAAASFQAGRPEQAAATLRRFLQKSPSHAGAQNMLGLCMFSMGQHAGAIYQIERALKLEPGNAKFHRSLAMAYQAAKEFEKARAACERSLALDPNYWAAVNDLGNILFSMGELKGAEECHRRVVALAPEYAANWGNVASTVGHTGKIEEAVSLVRQGLGRHPTDLNLLSGVLLLMNYVESIPPEEITEASRRYGAAATEAGMKLGLARSVREFANTREPDRVLRVGFVSPDLRTHSVSFFFQTLLENLPRDRFFTVCYDTGPEGDALTERLKQHAGAWRTVRPASTQKVVESARSDRLDIAVDLSGHTKGHSLAAFACRLAPVQVSFLGYPATTGVPAMDWRLADSLTDPPGEGERYCTERLHRLDPCLWCFRAPSDSPDISPLPADAAGHVTFGSFNAMPKMTPACLDLWCEVLKAVPGSRVLIKNQPLKDAWLRGLLIEQFVRRGIDAARVEVIGAVKSQAEHMALYSRIDIGLDTWPYHGTTTTCDAFWMGVPVVSMAGRAHVARVGLSLLDAVGLRELAADTPQGFVAAAASLAGDRDKLRAVRASMRDRMNGGPLSDERAYGERFGAALRAIWHDFCRTGA